FSFGPKAAELAQSDPFYEKFNTNSYRGNMNTSIIKTGKGRTIMLQHDVSSPRPYSRHHMISGTLATAQKYPLPGRISLGHTWLEPGAMKELEEKYTPGIVRKVGDIAKKV